MNRQTIELDISKPERGHAAVRLAQGDSGGAEIEALIYDHGEEVQLDSCEAWLVATLPDGRGRYRAKCATSGNAAIATVDESRLCAVPGYTDEAYFSVAKDGRTYSTERFALDIERGWTEE